MAKRPITRNTKTKKAESSARQPAAASARKRAPRRAAEPEEPGKPGKPGKPSATPKARRTAAVAAPPRQPVYSLEGPIPPEGAGLPQRVGALLGVGQSVLGITSFRPGQAEAFKHLLSGEDLLAVMPTGSGKSLLYQLTSLVVPGVTVVVSPLIALIKDQLDKMVAKGVSACKIDSTLTVKQRREVDALVRSPGGKLLLTTPERMADPEFRVFLREASAGVGVSRFVVDEAHCVSQWGHDFRPAYLSLRKAIDDVGRPPVLATTATAPPHVRDDILFQLGIEQATVVTTTFDRPNLHYEVIIFHDEDEKMKTLVTLLRKLPRPGIVYCATVKKVEELYEALTRWGIPVAKYHGRMNKGERDDAQQRFMASSELVMVATNAFGLGVDKSNIRNVLHYHVPGSLEAYAQEAGRGGRDGKPARCVLLFSPDDVAIQEYFLSGTYPTKRQVRQVFETLEVFTKAVGTTREQDSTPTVGNIALGSGVGQQRTRTVLSLLKDEAFITEREGGLYYVADPPPDPQLLMERARQYEARRIADRQRLDALLTYVKAPGCRNQVVLQYLGEPSPPPCGRCDNCLRSRESALAASTEATRLGASVTRLLDDDSVELPKPRREVKARVVRIDAPASAPGQEPPGAKVASAVPSSGPSSGTPTAVLRRSASAPEPISNGGASAQLEAAGTQRPLPRVADEEEFDQEEDLEAVGDDGDEPQQAASLHDEDEDDYDDYEDEDDDDDDDDDDDYDEDDDDLDDEDDEDDEDEEDDADDDYEVIDKTAAELAEEGVETSGEITVLARKKLPKAPRQRPQPDLDTSAAGAAEARRRRRRRRRKRRAMLPPKSAFVTPVLSTVAPVAQAQLRRGGGSGPVIEYVRGPMRIAMAPVASANPNDAGSAKRRRPRGRPSIGTSKGRWGGPPNGGFGAQNAPLLRGPDGEPRRRRRRRRRGGNGNPMMGKGGPGSNQALGDRGEYLNGSPSGPGEGEPTRFFYPNGPQSGRGPVLGPDGQPLRRRRRRRRRGGRHRQWRNQGPGNEESGPQ